MLTLFFLATSVVSSAKPVHFDPPNLNLERKLHQQYLKAHAPDSWSEQKELAKDAYLENYRIQPGETLWSLSHVLYGDGSYWPRVWAQNHSITNPHLIRPGHSLQFLLGSEDDTPAFRFTEQDEDSGAELVASNNPVIEIPPPESPPRPVIAVPPSFPEWQNISRRQPRNLIDDSGIIDTRRKPVQKILLRGYVQDKPVQPIGYFLENDTEAGLPLVNQYVYVKVKKGQGQVGDKMMVVGNSGKLKQIGKQYTPRVEAFLVQISGEIELSSQAQGRQVAGVDLNEYDIYRALVTKTTGLSQKDYALVDGSIPVVDIAPEGPAGSVEARVIGSEIHVVSQLYGQGSVVFIDKGSRQGVAPGQIFSLFVNRKSRHPQTPVEYSVAASGKLKVVKVDDEVATAVILDAHDGIIQGDLIRPPVELGEKERQEHVDLDEVQAGVVKSDDDEYEKENLDDDSELEKEIDAL